MDWFGIGLVVGLALAVYGLQAMVRDVIRVVRFVKRHTPFAKGEHPSQEGTKMAGHHGELFNEEKMDSRFRENDRRENGNDRINPTASCGAPRDYRLEIDQAVNELLDVYRDGPTYPECWSERMLAPVVKLRKIYDRF